jgi:hypothetical protein
MPGFFISKGDGVMSETSEQSVPPAPMSDHVKIILKQLFDEQTTIKQQQWRITNYAVLLLAGTFTLKTQTPHVVDPFMVSLIAGAVALLGVALVSLLQCDLGRYRNRIDKIHAAYFTKDELKTIGLRDDQIATLGVMSNCKQSIRGLEFTSALVGVLLIGALLVFASG